MSYKIAISKPGYNVLTETDPNNLIFSSDYGTLKYFTSGSLTISVSVAANTQYSVSNSIVHNLGYLPFTIVFGNQPKSMTGYAPLGIEYSFIDDGITNIWFRRLRFWVTSSRLYVGAEGLRVVAGDSYIATFYYKIYRNDLNL